MISARAFNSEPAPLVASPWFVRAIDRTFIVFMYVNVLAPKVTVAGIPVSKAFFGLSLALFTFHAFLHPSRHLFKGTAFVGTSFAMVTFLAIVGAMKGNNYVDIVAFLGPLIILLAAPEIKFLTERYGFEKYLKHVVISTTLLALYLLSIYFVRGPLQLPAEALLIPDQPGFISISFPGGTPKVIAVTTGFFPAGLVAAYYLAAAGGAARYYFPIIVISSGVYIGQTMGIWAASVLALLAAAAVIRGSSIARRVILWTTIPLVATFIIVGAISRGEILDPMAVFETKVESVDQKQMQAIELFQVFVQSPIFGRGLGYSYQLSEISSLSDHESVFVESSYSMILASTGIAGALCYAFIYLYYPLLHFRKRAWQGPATVVAISHVAILVASVGLPYMWSGGMGLFFLTFLIAWVDNSYVPVPRLLQAARVPMRPGPPGWRRAARSISALR